MIEEGKRRIDIASFDQVKQIKLLEGLDIALVPKSELILIVLGVKPATCVSLAPWVMGSADFEAAMKKIDLKYAYTGSYPNGSGDIFQKYVVAKKREDLETLKGLSAKTDHEEYGRLMGYPPTAVEAFVKGTLMPVEDQPSDETAIYAMRYSRDNWQEEHKLNQYWTALLKHYAPETYQQLIPSKAVKEK